ncbi:MAG TPA: hypothetical protein VMY99_01155 [Nevskiaceae bacterium]|nr:hypothetical protein [Nevskiaceae bacterium]
MYSKKIIPTFQKTVWDYYAAHGRHDLPWRQVEPNGQLDPYKVVVSEIMLQQTQVPRVVPKFTAFMATFPSFRALAAAPLADVLRTWSGLGYNRRAKFLWLAAQAVVQSHGGQLPNERKALEQLPGIGPNTAGAILAYAFNQSAVFIETNIRTVYIHHFFADINPVGDKHIAEVVSQTLPTEPRLWYWALMDYGTHLKQTVGNKGRASATYTKQSAFHGSRRQIRGQVLRALGNSAQNFDQLAAQISDNRLPGVLQDLVTEQLIEISGTHYQLHGA